MPDGSGTPAPPDNPAPGEPGGTTPPDASMPDGSDGAGSPILHAPCLSPPPAGGGPDRKRKDPPLRDPRQRPPQGWVTSIQLSMRSKATCRECCQVFRGGEVRMARKVDARGNRSSYSHVHCVELHPLDTLEHVSVLSPEQLACIERSTPRQGGLWPHPPCCCSPQDYQGSYGCLWPCLVGFPHLGWHARPALPHPGGGPQAMQG